MYNLLKRFICDQSGQGITEYGAILAFVALLVGLVFSLATGGLEAAISQSFSSVISQLNQLNGGGS
jgi:Flp pilus assembly pilin Flp